MRICDLCGDAIRSRPSAECVTSKTVLFDRDGLKMNVAGVVTSSKDDVIQARRFGSGYVEINAVLNYGPEAEDVCFKCLESLYEQMLRVCIDEEEIKLLAWRA